MSWKTMQDSLITSTIRIKTVQSSIFSNINSLFKKLKTLLSISHKGQVNAENFSGYPGDQTGSEL